MATDELLTASLLGQRGGRKTSQLYGKNHYRQMQAKGVQTKLRKKKAKTAPLTTA